MEDCCLVQVCILILCDFPVSLPHVHWGVGDHPSFRWAEHRPSQLLIPLTLGSAVVLGSCSPTASDVAQPSLSLCWPWLTMLRPHLPVWILVSVKAQLRFSYHRSSWGFHLDVGCSYSDFHSILFLTYRTGCGVLALLSLLWGLDSGSFPCGPRRPPYCSSIVCAQFMFAKADVTSCSSPGKSSPLCCQSQE
jgi:hypothetical protein